MNFTRTKLVLFILLLGSCIEPFNPALNNPVQGVVVVEGYINAGPGKSLFKLSRSVPVDRGEQRVDKENDALITIVNDQDQRYELIETESGLYESDELNLPTDASYKIEIQLKTGEQYESALLPVKVTPAIDSISWTVSDQLYLYVNTHDPQGSTFFYQWTYAEDWQIRSPLKSLLKWEDDTVKTRSREEQAVMYNCWKSSSSKDLYFASSQSFQRDEMKFNLIKFPLGAEETSVKYSVIVKQHALTEEDFNYLRLIQRNTSVTGSFFDPVPTQLYGNIVNIKNADELVVGYVGAYTTESKTLFINNYELPAVGRGFKCQEKILLQTDLENISIYLGENGAYEPQTTWTDVKGSPWMSLIERSCVDCRVYGSTMKPEHWD
jgi:hypothetical protein